MGLRVLQVSEIPRNGQRNVWKSLEKKGLDLEMFGENTWGLAVAPAGMPRRTLSAATPRYPLPRYFLNRAQYSNRFRISRSNPRSTGS